MRSGRIKLSKKTPAILIASLLCASLLAGCGASGGDGNSASNVLSGSEQSGSGAASTSASSGAASGSQESGAQTVSDEGVTREVFAMDTYMSVTAYGSAAEQAVHDAIDRIQELDKKLTTGDDTSEVGSINKNGGGVLSEDGKELMKRSLELYNSTGGVFDISIYPIMQLWGFPTKEYRVPDETEIAEKLSLADASQIRFDEGTGQVSFGKDGMEIDFGGIAKGYTSASIMKLFQEEGVTSGLVNLGGNVQLLGTKPDGSDWRVGIRGTGEGEEAEDYLGILEGHDVAVITSGGYERYFEEGGKRYHHIIDPATGYPAESGIVSSTVVSSDGTLADGLSTTLFIMGPDRATQYWREHADEFDFILLKEDGTLLVTEGIADHFTSDRKIEVVTRQS
jgi:thiamine biosynthesis lipoprotein